MIPFQPSVHRGLCGGWGVCWPWHSGGNVSGEVNASNALFTRCPWSWISFVPNWANAIVLFCHLTNKTAVNVTFCQHQTETEANKSKCYVRMKAATLHFLKPVPNSTFWLWKKDLLFIKHLSFFSPFVVLDDECGCIIAGISTMIRQSRRLWELGSTMWTQVLSMGRASQRRS